MSTTQDRQRCVRCKMRGRRHHLRRSPPNQLNHTLIHYKNNDTMHVTGYDIHLHCMVKKTKKVDATNLSNDELKVKAPAFDTIVDAAISLSSKTHEEGASFDSLGTIKIKEDHIFLLDVEGDQLTLSSL